MKKISSLIAILLLCAVTLFAQAPEKFTYQAVVRNASNSLVANAQVGVRVNILQGSASGNAVYSESHMATTNANGLITVNIGGGSVLHGTFANIDWANGPYFLKTDIDPNGGNDYSITSAQQLLSVPYALYAKDAGNGFSGDYNDLVNVPQIPQIPANVSAFNNDAGYITGYTETDPQYNAWDKDYNDLINKPTIPTVPTNVSAFTNDAGYITLNQVPAQVNADWTATSGAALILNKPTLFSGNYDDLTNKPTLFDGNYNSLSNKPNLSAVAISGSYNDLINKPSIPTAVGELTNNVGYITLAQVPAQVNADWTATTGAAQILNKPNIPTVPTNVSAFTNDAGYITSAAIPTVPTNVSAFMNDAGYVTAADVQQAAGVPTNVSAFNNDMGYLTSYTETDPLFTSWGKNYNTLNNKPNLAIVATTGSYNDLTNKPTIPTVPTNVSVFTNDAGYITSAAIPTVPTNVSAFTNDAGYVTAADVQQAAGVPTNVSAFNNDMGYLTSYTETDPLFTAWGKNYNTLNNKPNLATVAMTGNYNDLTNKPILATVATSGNYNDLSNRPTVPTVPTNVSAFTNDAGYITTAQVPEQVNADWNATSGKAKILNKPTIPTVPTNISAFTNDVGYVTSTDVQQAVGVPTVVSAFQNDVGYITADQIPTQINADWNATAGAAQILNKPSLFSGNYNDLINKPTFAVVATSGNYNDLNNKPALFSGNYNDLSNRPNFATVATSGNYNDLTNKPNIPTVPTNVSSFSNDAYYVTYNQLLSLIDSIKSIYNSKIDSLNDVISSIDNQSSLPCGSYVVSDFDGNIYTTVPIGSQCWLQQNLRTTKYADGEPITAGGVGTGNWTSSTSIAYWYYPNDQNVASHIDGYMYNVKAVLHNDSYASNSSTSVQGPCPNGWHVPSESEWNTLVDYVLNNNLLACGSGAAKALASTSGWTSTGNNNCCPTSNTFPEKANRTGFSALPCGYLKPSSTGSSWGFLEYGEAAYFWTTPSSSSPKLFRIRYSYSTTDITSAGMSSWYAFPIRCLRD